MIEVEPPGRAQRGVVNKFGNFAIFAAIHCLGQSQVAPKLLQMRGHDCPSEGLRPLWRVDPDLERDPDSRQHATQHNDLERRHCLWPK